MPAPTRLEQGIFPLKKESISLDIKANKMVKWGIRSRARKLEKLLAPSCWLLAKCSEDPTLIFENSKTLKSTPI